MQLHGVAWEALGFVLFPTVEMSSPADFCLQIAATLGNAHLPIFGGILKYLKHYETTINSRASAALASLSEYVAVAEHGHTKRLEIFSQKSLCVIIYLEEHRRKIDERRTGDINQP